MLRTSAIQVLVAVLVAALAMVALPGPRGHAGPADLPHRITVAQAGGPSNGDIFGFPSVSDDGSLVVFASSATDLTGDTYLHPGPQIFLWQKGTDSITLISRVPGTTTAGNGSSYEPVISGDGTRIAFSSSAADLTADADNNGPFGQDIYLYDRPSDTMTLVSRAIGGGSGDGESSRPRINQDGNGVAFHSDAADLTIGDVNGQTDVFHYWHPAGTPTSATADLAANGASEVLDIDDSGSYVLLESEAHNLTADNDFNDTWDLFLWEVGQDIAMVDRQVGNNSAPSRDFHSAALSGDGSAVALSSDAGNLWPGDTNAAVDVFHWDRATQTTRLVTAVAGSGGQTPANGKSEGELSISEDGTTVTFTSTAGDLEAPTGPTLPQQALFTWDTASGQAVRRAAGDADIVDPALSDDGRTAVFTSAATDLTTDTVNGLTQAYAIDLDTGKVALMSRDSSGAPADHEVVSAHLSGGGDYALFRSDASNLPGGADPGGGLHLWLQDLTGTALPVLSVLPTTVVEPAAGTTAPAAVTVELDQPAPQQVTVEWATSDGTALAGSDYLADTGTVTFPVGEQVATIQVEVRGDDQPEGDEGFIITLSNPQGATLGTPTATVTITEAGPTPLPAGTSRLHAAGGSDDPVDLAVAACELLVAQPDTANAVVLGRDDVYADVLGGTALAGDRGCVLLTDGGADRPLSPVTRAAIDRALPAGGQVWILGGTAAVSAQVEADLVGAGYDVQRLAGASRVETAVAVAQQVRAVQPGTEVLLAYGFNFADALMGGAYGAATRTPVVLTDTAELHPATGAFLARDATSQVWVLGGSAVVSDAVVSQLPPATRVAGPNRMGTAVAIAEQLWTRLPNATPPSTMVFADIERDDGWVVPLVLAPVSAVHRAPQLGVGQGRYPPETSQYLAGQLFPAVPAALLDPSIDAATEQAIAADIQP